MLWLVLDALNVALAMRRPKGVIHHSDQGSQHTSIEFGHRCREAGVRPSIGDAYDNAMCESFFATPDASFSTGAGSRRKPRRVSRASISAHQASGAIGEEYQKIGKDPFAKFPRSLGS